MAKDADSEYQKLLKLSKQLQKSIDSYQSIATGSYSSNTHLSDIPLSDFLCSTCDTFIGRDGCPDHPTQKELFK